MMDILKTEMAYLSMFSKNHQVSCGTIFYDLDQPDKYMHNFMMIHKQKIDDDELKHYEKNHQKKGFVIFRFEDETDKAYAFFNDYKKSTYGYYQANINSLSLPLARPYEIAVVDPNNDLDFFDFMYQEDLEFGINYAIGNIKKQKDVLIKESDRFFYLFVKNDDQIIGHINAFIEGSHAKIDEFYVAKSYQKKGYGTALMAKMIEILKEKQMTDVYLVTNLEDTAQTLYERYGFTLTGHYLQYQKMF